jgi:WD40 repeat protein
MVLLSGNAVCAQNKPITRLIDLTSFCRPFVTFNSGIRLCQLAYSPDPNLLLVGGQYAFARLFDVKKLAEVQQFQAPSFDVCNILNLPPGRVAIAFSGAAVICSIKSGQILSTLGKKSVTATTNLCASSNGSSLFICHDNKLSKWNIKSGLLEKSATDKAEVAFYGVAYNPSNNTIATCGAPASIIIRDASTLAKQWIAGADNLTPFNFVAFSPDGELLVAADQGGFTTVWDVATHKIRYRFGGFGFGCNGLAVSQSGKYIAVCGGYSFNIWNLKSGKNIGHIEPPAPTNDQRSTVISNQMSSVAFSPDGKWLATSTDAGLINIWNFQRILQLSREHHGK